MPADPSTYATLQTSVEAWLGQDFEDTQIEEFIALAERHFQRSVFTPDRESALSLTVDAQSEALPADFWGFKSGPYIDGSTDTVLTRLEPGDLRATYPDATTGTPAHYAIEGENILFGPTPGSSITVKGTYYATIAVLSDANTTNWLLTDYPDLYLAGALAEGFLYHMDEARASLWAGKRDAIIDSINKAGMRRSANSGPLTATHSVQSISNIQA